MTMVFSILWLNSYGVTALSLAPRKIASEKSYCGTRNVLAKGLLTGELEEWWYGGRLLVPSFLGRSWQGWNSGGSLCHQANIQQRHWCRGWHWSEWTSSLGSLGGHMLNHPWLLCKALGVKAVLWKDSVEMMTSRTLRFGPEKGRMVAAWINF